jgi:hypothetical protein
MKRFVAVLSVIVVFGVVTADVALAAKARTRLSLRIEDDSVGSNDTIVLKGRLGSKRDACEGGKKVDLYIDGGLYASTTTSPEGRYTFEVSGPHPSGRHRFMTVFEGTRRCRRSASDSVFGTVGG